jgi:flagellar hook-associated protein FlgK
MIQSRIHTLDNKIKCEQSSDKLKALIDKRTRTIETLNRLSNVTI